MFHVRTFEPRTIRWWYNRIPAIDLEPPYQRKGGLWNRAAKQLLIDSILNEFDIPKLYFADFTIHTNSELNPNKKTYAVIDGKQRLEAIIEFIEGDLPLSADFTWRRDKSLDLGGLTYPDLVKTHAEVAEAFDDYILTIIAVVTDEVGMINNQFIRLNSSKPLSGPELRNAFTGQVSDSVRLITTHKFFTSSIKFNTSRGQDNNLAAKLLLNEFVGRPTQTKKTNLDAFAKTAFEDAETDRIDFAVDGVLSTLGVMHEIFSHRDPLLSQSGTIPGYYWFIRGVSENEEFLVRSFLLHFEKERSRVRKNMKNMTVDEDVTEFFSPKDQPYVIYNTVLRSVDDASSIATRAQILRNEFRNWLERRVVIR